MHVTVTVSGAAASGKTKLLEKIGELLKAEYTVLDVQFVPEDFNGLLPCESLYVEARIK